MIGSKVTPAKLISCEWHHLEKEFGVDNAQVWCYTLEHMFERAKTAFKHPGCGGVIYAYERRGLRKFKCGTCGLWAEDVAELALGAMYERLAGGTEASPTIDAESSSSKLDEE